METAVASSSIESAHLAGEFANLLGEQLGLLEGGEVAARGDLVVEVDEVAVRALGPDPRYVDSLAGKDADARR